MALLRDAILPPSGQGSNNWVVDGTRTRTGMPLLANDPHLAIALPSVWYECHLVAPGINVTGVTLPFVSYGGSSVIANMVLLALLLLVSDRARRPQSDPPGP